MSDLKQSTFNLLEPLKQNYDTVRNFINGEWVEARTDRYLDVINPADGISIAKVPIEVAGRNRTAR
jgi:hypothetical protein